MHQCHNNPIWETYRIRVQREQGLRMWPRKARRSCSRRLFFWSLGWGHTCAGSLQLSETGLWCIHDALSQSSRWQNRVSQSHFWNQIWCLHAQTNFYQDTRLHGTAITACLISDSRLPAYPKATSWLDHNLWHRCPLLLGQILLSTSTPAEYLIFQTSLKLSTPYNTNDVYSGFWPEGKF